MFTWVISSVRMKCPSLSSTYCSSRCQTSPTLKPMSSRTRIPYSRKRKRSESSAAFAPRSPLSATALSTPRRSSATLAWNAIGEKASLCASEMARKALTFAGRSYLIIALSLLDSSPHRTRLLAGRRSAGALELLVDRNHPVLVDAFVDDGLEQRLRDETAQVHGKAPGLVGRIQPERQRKIAEHLAVAGAGGIAAEVKARPGNAPLEAAARQGHCEQDVGSPAPRAGMPWQRESRKGREMRVNSAVIDDSARTSRRSLEHLVVRAVVAQFNALVERADDPLALA